MVCPGQIEAIDTPDPGRNVTTVTVGSPLVRVPLMFETFKPTPVPFMLGLVGVKTIAVLPETRLMVSSVVGFNPLAVPSLLINIPATRPAVVVPVTLKVAVV